MASRTNKKGIAANKAKLERQASRLKGQKRFDYPKRKAGLQEAKDYGFVGVQVNPKGNAYHRFMRGRKICRETRMRIDPDGYRYVKLPSGSGDFVTVALSGWARKKLIKNVKKG